MILQHRDEPLAWYRECRLCPRLCGVDRTAGQRGRCGETAVCRVASLGAHFGEEPPITGSDGSGTVFFSGCCCRCFFCQNHDISFGGIGEALAPEELLERCMALVGEGVHNLNFVTPTHYLPHVVWLVRELRCRGVDLPTIYNSSGYERREMVEALGDVVDIFLPDFKFLSPGLAERVMGDRFYAERAMESLRVMVGMKGFLEPFDPTGLEVARRGVLLRHLVLPGQVDDSVALLAVLRHEFGRMLPLSLMSQYRPMPGCRERGAFSRQVRPEEYAEVCRVADDLGFLQVFTQPTFGDTGFVPDFRKRRPFAGNRPVR